MKNLFTKTVLVLAAFTALFSLSTQVAEAASPVLTLTNAGNNQVRIEVTGDVNSSVLLYFYNPSNSGNIVSVGSIGTTNSSGYFTSTVSSTAYGISAGANVFVNVNNQQSSSVAWPNITGGNIYLSQTNVSLNAGQSTTVNISGGSGSYYVSTNSNSNVATASISGNILTVSGTNSGSTNLTICSLSTSGGCVTLYVTVNGGGYNGQSISLSQNSVSVQVSQYQSVQIYGGGGYYISNNSNSSVVTATVNGSTLSVYGLMNGSATLNICSQQSNTSCASLYVTVYNSTGGYYYGGNNYYPYNNTGFTYGSSGNTYYQQPTIIRSESYGNPVSGVYLSQIPATGLKFNLKVLLFMMGLVIWSAALAYFFLTSRTNKKLGFVSHNVANGKTKADVFKMNQMLKRQGK